MYCIHIPLQEDISNQRLEQEVRVCLYFIKEQPANLLDPDYSFVFKKGLNHTLLVTIVLSRVSQTGVDLVIIRDYFQMWMKIQLLDY